MPIGPEFPGVLDAARQGADWAWRALYRDLASAVLGYAGARGAHSPEDICSDVFCDVVRGLPRFDGDENAFRAWVFLIAHHRVIDEHRRSRRRAEVPSSLDDIDISTLRSTEDEALEHLAIGEVRSLIAGLTPPQQDVLLLRLVADLDVDQVAAVMGKRPGSIRALQHRALETLRRTLSSRNAIESLSGS